LAVVEGLAAATLLTGAADLAVVGLAAAALVVAGLVVVVDLGAAAFLG